MKLEHAKHLHSTLGAAIAKAEETGSDEIDLVDALDADLSQALGDAEAELKRRQAAEGG